MKNLLAVLLLFFTVNTMAEGASSVPQMGKEYDQTTQIIATANPAKIEVIELFWYGCSHCYNFEPTVTSWVKSLSKDVTFKRVPGLPNPSWAPMAKTHYALEALGLTEKLHAKLFEAIHKQKTLDPTNELAAIDWITKESGLNRKKVQEAFNSFSTSTQLNRAAQIFRASGATGVPSLVIDGKYITSLSTTNSNEELVRVANYLINQARNAKK
ncbi:MAG: thiol:disulfide interchange protein DsbA/DsbL [Methylophilaceae bacterium]|nr:thiol:disulfide interchange protein DsbA/DsbL [Methylophilaceae bacterium]